MRLYTNHERGDMQTTTVSGGPRSWDLYLFDMGNVVIEGITVIEKIAEYYHLEYEELLDDYKKYEFPLMDGAIDSDVYWDHVEERFSVRVEKDPLAIFFKPYWNAPVVQILTSLKSAGKRVVCASNTYAPHWEYLDREGYFFIFDKVYASHELKVTKPSRQFFERILTEEHADAENTLFIDDYLINVSAARALGMTAFHYDKKSNKDIDRDLASFLGV